MNFRATRNHDEIKFEVRIARKRKADEEDSDFISRVSAADGVTDESYHMATSSESIDENANPQTETADESGENVPTKRPTRASKIQRKSSRPLLVDRTNQAV